MSEPRGALERLGEEVAREQDRQLDAGDAIERARVRLQSPRAERPRWPLVAAGLGLAAAAALVAWTQRPGRELAFSVDGEAGQAERWLAAPPAEALPLRFTDGTSIDLSPAARARVTGVDAHGARVVLERGRADVAVAHRPGARWVVSAGPFEVRVTGTRFAVEWDATVEVFRLAMGEGSVEVSGPCAPSPLRFKAGDKTALVCTGHAASAQPVLPPLPAIEPTSTPSAAVALAPPSSASSEPAPPPSSPPSSPLRGTPSSPSTSATPPATPSAASSLEVPAWRQLTRERRFRDALAAAEAAGFDELCATLPASDLASLADAARFGGSTARAQQALKTLRQRFPGDGRSAIAAYTLGRIAFDQRGAYADAAGWFSTFLSEQPSGPLAQEAMGRLLEARQRAGDAAGARHTAQQYLVRFPGGPHEAMARRLLEEKQER